MVARPSQAPASSMPATSPIQDTATGTPVTVPSKRSAGANGAMAPLRPGTSPHSRAPPRLPMVQARPAATHAEAEPVLTGRPASTNGIPDAVRGAQRDDDDATLPALAPGISTTMPSVAAELDEASDDGLREVKVRLPVDQVMRLHFTRMTRRKNFSQIVSTALTRYFDDMQKQ